MVRARDAGSVVSGAMLLCAALVACSSDSSGVLARTSTPSGDDGGPGGGADASPSQTNDAGSPPAGDGGPAISNGPDKPNCKYQAHKTGLTSLQQAGGLSFTVYAPSTYDPKIGHAVVVIMHGQDSNGVPELQALWQPIADQEGLVLVAPRGSRPSTTNDPTVGNWATADLNHVLEIMTDVDDCYDVLTKKHILWGFSEGCFYGYLLGVGAAGRFSGLAMGGANMSFARSNGYAPADASWAIPVSHVHGTQDPNPISITYQDRTDFQAAGHVFTLHEHPGGHTITADQVRTQYDDLKASSSP
jgi:poly(3-hydroxybutyrate) depolymerase